MRDALDPVFGFRSIDGGGDEAEVAALVVGADEPDAVAVVNVVLVLVPTRRDDMELSLRLVGRAVETLAGRVAGRLHDDVFAVAGAACPDVEAFVGLLEDQGVGRVGSAAHVPVELELALLLFVFHGVEEVEAVGGPDYGANPFDAADKDFSGLQVFDLEGVLAEAGGVDGKGHPAAVVGDVDSADGEEGVSAGHLVAIEDDFLFGIVLRPAGGAALATVDGVLEALLRAGVVPIVAIPVGNGNVGLLDVAQHLVVELLAKGSKWLHERFGVCVFGLEIPGDLGVLLVAKPGVVVGEYDPVEFFFGVFNRGDGRRGQRGGLSHLLQFRCCSGGKPPVSSFQSSALSLESPQCRPAG